MYRAKIDFHGACGHPSDANVVTFELLTGDGEPGTSPVFARFREITYGDEDSFDTNYAHDVQPWSEAIVS